MRLKRTFTVLLFLASCFLVGTSVAYDERLRLYTEPFPPYNFEENGDIKGINADILSELCKRAGIECTFIIMSWTRGMSNALSNQDSGLFSTARTPAREEQFNWVGPLVYSNSCLYKFRTRDDVKISDNTSLQNYTIGIARGDVYQAVLDGMGLKEGQHYLTYSNKYDDLKMFVQQKHELIISSPLSLESQLALVKLVPADVEPVLEIDETILGGNYLALNKGVKAETLRILSEQLAQMKAEGRVDDIIKRYVSISEDMMQFTAAHVRRCVSNPVSY